MRKEEEELSGWTCTNAWLASGFNGSLDEYLNNKNRDKIINLAASLIRQEGAVNAEIEFRKQYRWQETTSGWLQCILRFQIRVLLTFRQKRCRISNYLYQF